MASGTLSNEDLMRKYAGGRIPPLIDATDSRFGLVNDKLFEIYQRGFCGVHEVPLGLLLAEWSPTQTAGGKWVGGNYHYNQSAEPDWVPFCRLVRDFVLADGSRPGDLRCEASDRRRAAMAEKAGVAMAYLCCHGLIDFAVPVCVGGQCIAVIFSGQVRPAADQEWPPGLVQIDPALTEGQDGPMDLRSLSDSLIERVADYGMPREAVMLSLGPRASARQVHEIGPVGIKGILGRLDRAAGHLSDLANKTYDLEKLRVASFVRFAFARPLGTLRDDLGNWRESAARLREGLALFSEFYGCEYAFLCRVQKGAHVRIMCAHGLPALEAEGVTIPLDIHSAIRASVPPSGLTTIPLSLLAEAKVLAPVLASFRQAGVADGSLAYVEPEETPGYFLLFGSARCGWPGLVGSTDAVSLREVATIACLVSETVSLIGEVHEAQQATDRFMEDVAHDIRTPIQNVINKAAMLKRVQMDQPQCAKQAQKVAAAVMRVHLVARRVWTVQRLHRGALAYRTQSASILETVSKAVDAVEDLSADEGVQIVVERDALESMPSLAVDTDLFFETVLNLLHNAVKYSNVPVGRPPQVIIKGSATPSECVLSIGNRGIEISDGDIPRIFDRGFRTTQAYRKRSDGSGIGLSIVKDFVDHYRGSVKVSSTPIEGTTDYLTVIEIHLPRGGRP
jgi:signal transduction histidine kinase